MLNIYMACMTLLYQLIFVYYTTNKHLVFSYLFWYHKLFSRNSWRLQLELYIYKISGTYLFDYWYRLELGDCCGLDYMSKTGGDE